MIVFVCILIDVESQRKFSIPLQPSTFVVTLQALYRIPLCEFSCTTLYFLLDTLAIAGNEDLVLTWLVFLTCKGTVALVFTRMSTALVFATSLLAGL